MKRLKETHGCKGLKEAKALLERKVGVLEEGKEELEKAEAEFRERWEGKL